MDAKVRETLNFVELGTRSKNFRASFREACAAAWESRARW